MHNDEFIRQIITSWHSSLFRLYVNNNTMNRTDKMQRFFRIDHILFDKDNTENLKWCMKRYLHNSDER